MNWFQWSFGDAGWTVPFWFLPLVFFWIVRTNLVNKNDKAVDESLRRLGELDKIENAVSVVNEESATSFDDKCAILADIWLGYRDEAEFIDFIEYNDLGLPLAYAISNGIVDSTPMAAGFVNEAFDLLLTGYGIEDSGFESMDDILEMVDGAVFGEGNEEDYEESEVGVNSVEDKPADRDKKY
jgi:hypothetical protein